MLQDNSGNLDMVKMKFVEAETLSWKELFRVLILCTDFKKPGWSDLRRGGPR